MESIGNKVAIIGMGCTRFGERWDKGPYDLIIEACSEALEDAGIAPEDIQQAWFGSLTSGFSGSSVSNALKLEYIPITRVENFCSGGLHALGNACYAVAAGVCDIAFPAPGRQSCRMTMTSRTCRKTSWPHRWPTSRQA